MRERTCVCERVREHMYVCMVVFVCVTEMCVRQICI